VRSLFDTEEGVRKVASFRPSRAILLRGRPDELAQMAALIEQIDIPPPAPPTPPARKFALIPVRHAKAGDLAKHIELMSSESSSRRSSSRSSSQAPRPRVSWDERTNVVLMRGTQEQIDRAKALTSALDVPIEQYQSE
jgi:type II secretory pathway component GspD/PulD (secretin)